MSVIILNNVIKNMNKVGSYYLSKNVLVNNDDNYIRCKMIHEFVVPHHMFGVIHVAEKVIQSRLNKMLDAMFRYRMSAVVSSTTSSVSIEFMMRADAYNYIDNTHIKQFYKFINTAIKYVKYESTTEIEDRITQANIDAYEHKHTKHDIIDRYISKCFREENASHYMYDYLATDINIVRKILKTIHSNVFLSYIEVEAYDKNVVELICDNVHIHIDKSLALPVDVLRAPMIFHNDDRVIVDRRYRYNACILEYDRLYSKTLMTYTINKEELMQAMFNFIFIHNPVFKTSTEVAIMQYKFDKRGVREFLLNTKGITRKKRSIAIFDTSLIRPSAAKESAKSIRQCIALKIESLNHESFRKCIKIMNYNINELYNVSTFPRVDETYINRIGNIIRKDILCDISLAEFKDMSRAILNRLHITFISQDN